MNRFEEDNELRRLIKSMKPESLGADFSSKVMMRVHEKQEEMDRIRSERIFGKWFWIILAAFISLFMIVIFVPETTSYPSAFPGIIPEFDRETISALYSSLFKTFDVIPTSVAGILLASSLLLILEGLLSSRVRVY
jgi:NADH:ubiquinone oxidoreductase subunit 6 (subunit J)